MDDLQFEKADYGGTATPCAMCNRGIEGQYWQANGHPVCQACASQLSATQNTPGRNRLIQGAIFALGAAAAASIAYAAILIVTGYDLALVSIAVGWLVGKAARQGTGGIGGRPVQIVAVVATYIAICGSLFFQILYSFFKEGNVVTSLAGYVSLFLFALGKPVLEMREGFGGILGLLILFFGLMQAWQQTGAARLDLSGPYPAGTVQQN